MYEKKIITSLSIILSFNLKISSFKKNNEIIIKTIIFKLSTRLPKMKLIGIVNKNKFKIKIFVL